MMSPNDAPDRPIARKLAVMRLGVIFMVVLGIVADSIKITVNEMRNSMRIIGLGCFVPRVHTHALFSLFGVHEMTA